MIAATEIASPGSPPDTVPESYKPNKWELLQTARGLVFQHARLFNCHGKPKKPSFSEKFLNGGEGSVQVRAGRERAWFKGVWKCGDVWRCAVCSEHIGNERRTDFQRAIDYWLASGRGVSLRTLTQRHTSEESLSRGLERFRKSLRSFKSGRATQRAKKKWGIVGEARVLEVTYGAAGWHVHEHSILFSNAPIEREALTQLKDDTFVRWYLACERNGAQLPSHANGVDVRGANYAADYVTKWGFAEEMALSIRKNGRAGGLTPWQLLAAAHCGSQWAARLWTEFAECFQDARQVYWSPGLRKACGLTDDELTDQEVMELESDPEPETVATIDADTWAVVVKSLAFTQVLELAVSSPIELAGFLQSLRATVPLYGGRRLDHLHELER